MIELAFVGDIFPGDELFTKGFGIRSKTNHERMSQWANQVQSVLGSEPICVMGNLESPLVDDEHQIKSTFGGKPDFCQFLKSCNIGVVNVANNHILEQGVHGFHSTINVLNEYCIETVGTVDNDKVTVKTIELSGIKISVVGFCDERVCNIKNPHCYASLDIAKVFDSLELAKSHHPDIIIFWFHWGDEYIRIPSIEQRVLAYNLIDNGVNLIVGCHPHVIQPYEHYKNGHIIYSLGNFCFDDIQSKHFGIGMIAKIKIDDNHIKEITFVGVELQDMAYTDSLVKGINHNAFETYFTEINYMYDNVKRMEKEEYAKYYERLLRLLHLKERINMKLNLIRKVLNPRHRYKKQLMRNVLSYLMGRQA